MPVTINFNLPSNQQRPQRRQLFRTSDGDTPVIEQPVRMVSCDTPEKAGYAGKPEKSQPKLDKCRQRLSGGFYSAIPKKLRDYLIARLGPKASEHHIAAGEQASAVFDELLESRLTRSDGTKRGVAVIATGEIVDRYGRLLAYMAPWFGNTPSDPLPAVGHPARNTFNLEMIANGWAAFFPVYGSLPKDSDMNLAIDAAEKAWKGPLGAWKEHGKKVLLAYEFRACIKLGMATSAAKGIADAFQRVCVDLSTLKVVGRFGFHAVPPPHRLWVWQENLAQAINKLGLTPET